MRGGGCPGKRLGAARLGSPRRWGACNGESRGRAGGGHRAPRQGLRRKLEPDGALPSSAAFLLLSPRRVGDCTGGREEAGFGCGRPPGDSVGHPRWWFPGRSAEGFPAVFSPQGTYRDLAVPCPPQGCAVTRGGPRTQPCLSPRVPRSAHARDEAPLRAGGSGGTPSSGSGCGVTPNRGCSRTSWPPPSPSSLSAATPVPSWKSPFVPCHPLSQPEPPLSTPVSAHNRPSRALLLPAAPHPTFNPSLSSRRSAGRA